MNNRLEAKKIAKSFHDGEMTVPVLKDVNLSVQKGELIAIVGPSGSGKSTLLHILGGLDSLTRGQVFLDGDDIWAMNEKARCRLRNQKIGFVYQFHHLLPEFSALENVMLPLLIGEQSTSFAEKKAHDILTLVGLVKRLTHKPSQLSGGERQRVAIARAMVTNPSLLLADEPTGNLDNKTAEGIYELLLNLNQKIKTAIIIVTHDLSLAYKMNRVMHLEDGVLLQEK